MSPNISPTRIAVINLLILSLLATLVGRLWYLQVLSGSEAQKLAERTSIRTVYEQAPRGFIFDRDGRTLARNRTALTVALDVSRVPNARKGQLIHDLAQVLQMKENEVRNIVDDKRLAVNAPRPIALDVDKNVVVYLAEHADEFPGVTDVEIPVREYPMHTVASHVIGHIGEINAEELKKCQDATSKSDVVTAARCRAGDLVGKLGVEKVYDKWIAGKPGIDQTVVNVNGDPVDALPGDPPQRGWDAILTLDAGVQVAAENALQDGINFARGLTDPDTGKKFKAPAGAVVAIDPTDGDVLALASNPDFDPNLLVGSAPPGALAALNAPKANMPFLNRAIAEAVPPGSTFKPFTAAAAWDVDPTLSTRQFDCPPSIKIGPQTFKDWQPGGQGTLDLSSSISQSCDITFYRLGVELNQKKTQYGEHLQDVAKQFGLAKPTGIDLLGESRNSVVPDAVWKWQHFSDAQTFNRRWFDGDSANLAVGQGFLQVTPVQLATAYTAIANDGVLVRPHILKCLAQLNVSQQTNVDQACHSGRVPSSAKPKVLGRVGAKPAALQFIENAMTGTVRGSGTASDAFAGFPLDSIFVAGKTGTAENPPREDSSWMAAIAKSGDKQIVVVAMVEEAGFGAQVAAPIVRRVLEQYFGVTSTGFHPGASIRG